MDLNCKPVAVYASGDDWMRGKAISNMRWKPMSLSIKVGGSGGSGGTQGMEPGFQAPIKDTETPTLKGDGVSDDTDAFQKWQNTITCKFADLVDNRITKMFYDEMTYIPDIARGYRKTQEKHAAHIFNNAFANDKPNKELNKMKRTCYTFSLKYGSGYDTYQIISTNLLEAIKRVTIVHRKAHYQGCSIDIVSVTKSETPYYV